MTKHAYGIVSFDIYDICLIDVPTVGVKGSEPHKYCSTLKNIARFAKPYIICIEIFRILDLQSFE